MSKVSSQVLELPAWEARTGQNDEKETSLTTGDKVVASESESGGGEFTRELARLFRAYCESYGIDRPESSNGSSLLDA